MSNPMTITSKKKGNKGIIYIDGTAHIVIDLTMVIGFQSWVSYDNTRIDRFKIELSIQGAKSVILEYNTAAKWKEIITELEALVTTVL